MSCAERAFGGFAVLIVSAGIFYLAFLMFNFGKSRDADRQAWPTVAGTVKSSDTHVQPGGEWTSAKIGITVIYSYTLDGRDFQQKQSWTRQCDWKCGRDAEELLQNFPVGKSVSVYYPPKHVDEGIINTNGGYMADWVDFVTWLIGLIGALFVVGALLIWFGIDLDNKET